MNNDFINEETAYAIIARCLQLAHVGKDIYVDRNGKTLVLTKYGFQESVLFDTDYLAKELFSEKAAMQNEITGLNNYNITLNRNIEVSKKNVERVMDEIQLQKFKINELEKENALIKYKYKLLEKHIEELRKKEIILASTSNKTAKQIKKNKKLKDQNNRQKIKQDINENISEDDFTQTNEPII